MEAEEKEVTFYSDTKGVRITNARLIVGTTTYAMRNISSVGAGITKPSLFWPLILIIVGLLIFVATVEDPLHSTRFLILAVLLILAGIVAWRGSKPTYHLRVSSSSGESTALSSDDKEYVGKVVQAVNEAIIHRG